MKAMKILTVYLVLAVTLITYRGAGLSFNETDNSAMQEYFTQVPESDVYVMPAEPSDCFEYAELITGFSAEILRGIAATESRFKANAVGDGGMSFGMFQLHSRWHESRVEKWGEFDPTDPFESAVIAGRIMQENLAAFNGDLKLAIAAYNQGVRGVRERGIIPRYVEDVLNWRNDSEKMLSLFLFCGITDIEGQQNGNKGTGTQNTYRLDDSLAVQVSWRGSSGISY
jgi:hypothetical protein